MSRRTRRPILLLGAITIGALALWAAAGSDLSFGRPGAGRTPGYVGTARCRICHETESAGWDRSQHRQAMQPATSATVLGDFSNARFTYAGTTSVFVQRDGRFFVQTDAADGTIQEFEVAYTFGVDPLQQYLVEFPDGRIQALSIAWDSRPAEAGGARWFHLYPGEEVDHTDELHWTGLQQNWNFMCADCHSTNVRKQYDAEADRFETTWSEVTVGCEACHGPGSDHDRWAGGGWLRDWRWPDRGLTTALTERRDVQWTRAGGDGPPVRSLPRETTREIDTCATCHSRRAQIAEGRARGWSLFDSYAPALLEPGLYYPDGQQRDEVYVYGSFLQSRMYQAGVTCADCHDPHTGGLSGTGNALCTTCHAPVRYDATSHHFHQSGSPGSSCIECHMPARTYMVVDGRRDHSLRVPRPDLAVSLEVPDACTACHVDQAPAWAAERVRAWYGRDAVGFQRFAEAFHADDTLAPGAAGQLVAVAGDAAHPAIARASALHRLVRYQDPRAVDVARSGLASPEALIRRAALSVLDLVSPQARPPLAVPLLDDAVRAVRLEAAWQLSPVTGALADPADRQAFDRAAEEFISAQRLVADRPEGPATLGAFFARLGRASEAAAEYRAAIELAPRFVPAYVNLAELLRLDGDESAADALLREGLLAVPDAGDLHYALGLSLARQRRLDEAVDELARARDLDPANARFAYAHAVGLNSAGRVTEALAAVRAAADRHPSDRDLLVALATFNRDAGRIEDAITAARRLRDLQPDDPEAQALLSALEGER